MQQFWPDSRDIALPGQGHSVTSVSWTCEGALIGAFIAQASPAHLDTSGVSTMSTITPPFDLTLQALAGSG